MATLSIAHMVRSARRRAGMTQVQLARAVGAPQSTIARIELGTVSPKAATLERLLKATGHELAVERRLGYGVDRAPILERLRLIPVHRIRQAIKARRSRRFDAIRILRRLRRFGVRFVLIGDLAAVAHGSPVMATAVEICQELSPENDERLRVALLDVASQAKNVRLNPTPAGTHGYADLDANATATLVAAALVVRVAHLDDLVRIGRAEGRADLQTLGALREETDRYTAPAML